MIDSVKVRVLPCAPVRSAWLYDQLAGRRSCRIGAAPTGLDVGPQKIAGASNGIA